MIQLPMGSAEGQRAPHSSGIPGMRLGLPGGQEQNEQLQQPEPCQERKMHRQQHPWEAQPRPGWRMPPASGEGHCNREDSSCPPPLTAQPAGTRQEHPAALPSITSPCENPPQESYLGIKANISLTFTEAREDSSLITNKQKGLAF